MKTSNYCPNAEFNGWKICNRNLKKRVNYECFKKSRPVNW